MDIIFPDYLTEEQYQYRHLKIHVMKNTLDLSSASDVSAYVKKQAKEVASVLTDGTAEVVKEGDLNGLLVAQKKLTDKINQVLNKKVRRIHSVTLPLPNDLQDSHSHEWSVETGIAGSIADKIYNGSDLAKAVAIGTDLVSARKPLADPGYFQNYKGTQPRTFNLSFDLVPNNTKEASNIIMILQLLRKYSLPDSSVDHALMLAPHFFDIEMSNPHIDNLINIKGVVITSMNVNYGADGNMQQTADGIPKHIKLDLTFAERRMSMADYYPDMEENK